MNADIERVENAARISLAGIAEPEMRAPGMLAAVRALMGALGRFVPRGRLA